MSSTRACGRRAARRRRGTLVQGRAFYYSEQVGPRDNYLVRNLLFDQQGRLLGRHAEFYVD
jgi:hypothetical protein